MLRALTTTAGKTALEVASLADHWDVVEGLLKLGADVNVVFTGIPTRSGTLPNTESAPHT